MKASWKGKVIAHSDDTVLVATETRGRRDPRPRRVLERRDDRRMRPAGGPTAGERVR